MLTLAGITIAIIAISIIVSLYQKNTNAFCKTKRKLDGKTTLVTGGTSGMGLEIAKDLAQRGAKVIVACPFDEEGKNAKELIIQETGNTKVIFKNLDLGSFKSVRDFAADILKSEDKLDILVNNAGVGVALSYTKPSVDGLNSIMQINFYGHFLLTLLLLPLLKKSPSSRIVNTSSILHRVKKLRRNLSTSVYPFDYIAYANSKLSFVYFASELTKRVKGSSVTVNCVDPGLVGTGIWNVLAGQFIGNILSLLFRNTFKTSLEGAQTAIYVAVDENVEGVSGGFFKNCKKSKAVSWAYNERDSERLWEHAVKVVKITDDELKHSLE